MAIKFSQFTVRTSSSDLSHIVGYNGVDNIQITPTNFLNSALTGTAGQVLFYDTTGVAGDNDLYWDNTNKRLGIGTTSPAVKLQINHTGGNNGIRIISPNDVNGFLQFGDSDDDNVGRIVYGHLNDSMQFVTNDAERMRITSTGNIGIGTASPSEKLEVNGNIKVGDSQQFVAGASNDLQIYHDGSNTHVVNFTGNLRIRNFADDSDITFESDDGSGGNTTYFFLDGSGAITRVSRNFRTNDSIRFQAGSSGDLNIYHDGTHSYIGNDTGNLYIQQLSDDSDIVFQSDDGSGGVTEYFKLDGSAVFTRFSQDIRISDNVQLQVGDSADLKILHNATDSAIINERGNLEIQQRKDDGDIIFSCDNGSGGTTEYFRLDGSIVRNVFSKNVGLEDNVQLIIGSGNDLKILHDGSDSVIQNDTGDLEIQNRQDDGDIVFKSDDGAGGVTEYFRVDGGQEVNVFSKNIKLEDNVKGLFGGGNDLQISHDAADSYIQNFTGDLKIFQNADDKDITFYNDDGSGGTTAYFFLDGSLELNRFLKSTLYNDNIRASFGDSSDLQIYHDGTTSYIKNAVGNLNIRQNADDADISFQCDDGSGSLAEYFRLDGSSVQTIAEKDFRFIDNAKVILGTGSDLQIYHNGSHSYIDDTGTGKLILRGNTDVEIHKYSGEYMITATADGAVSLYYDDVKKLETTSTGVKITGISEYADNTAAIAGGLTTGDVYRTGDLLKIVH